MSHFSQPWLVICTVGGCSEQQQQCSVSFLTTLTDYLYSGWVFRASAVQCLISHNPDWLSVQWVRVQSNNSSLILPGRLHTHSAFFLRGSWNVCIWAFTQKFDYLLYQKKTTTTTEKERKWKAFSGGREGGEGRTPSDLCFSEKTKHLMSYTEKGSTPLPELSLCKKRKIRSYAHFLIPFPASLCASPFEICLEIKSVLSSRDVSWSFETFFELCSGAGARPDSAWVLRGKTSSRDH